MLTHPAESSALLPALLPVPARPDERIICPECRGEGYVPVPLTITEHPAEVECWGCNPTGYALCLTPGCTEFATRSCASRLWCEECSLLRGVEW